MATEHEIDTAAKRKPFRSCIVPMCTNTSIKTPEKLFVPVPKGENIRKQWVKMIRRDGEFSPQSGLYCCEDHFDLPNDAENWIKFTLMGGKLTLKAGILPRFFECQRGRCKKIKPRGSLLKKERQTHVLQAFKNYDTKNLDNINEADTEGHQQTPSTSRISTVTAFNSSDENGKSLVKDASTQYCFQPSYRSKGIQVSILNQVHTASSPVKFPGVNITCSHNKQVARYPQKYGKTDEDSDSDSSTLSENKQGSDSEFLTTSVGENSSDESYVHSSCEANTDSELKNISLKRINILVRKNPRLYLGIPKDTFYIVDLLLKNTHGTLTKDNILLILKKIRLNDAFPVLADEFGISASHASRIFCKGVSILAACLKQLILWPPPESIRRNLPICFRARYNKVESIIDCLEIEIERPGNAVRQALTWSQYKQCNTLKYLVSCTPDGVVNFVSKGYSGRVSDVLLLEDSGYLDLLTPGCAVMADRGFKHIQQQLESKQCELVRPPSVSAGEKCGKDIVKMSKRISSLRIHIERTIRRFREFKLAAPHACIDNKLVGNMDNVMQIIGGLINMQPPLIR